MNKCTISTNEYTHSSWRIHIRKDILFSARFGRFVFIVHLKQCWGRRNWKKNIDAHRMAVLFYEWNDDYWEFNDFSSLFGLLVLDHHPTLKAINCLYSFKIREFRRENVSFMRCKPKHGRSCYYFRLFYATEQVTFSKKEMETMVWFPVVFAHHSSRSTRNHQKKTKSNTYARVV